MSPHFWSIYFAMFTMSHLVFALLLSRVRHWRLDKDETQTNAARRIFNQRRLATAAVCCYGIAIAILYVVGILALLK